ncbi:hypothetical protein MTO96_042360 [Rhipicephalus appendiculatus]
MEGMVVEPSSGRDRPPAARKRLSSSVASEAPDSESDVRSDDSEAFIPAKHRRSRRKSSTSSSSEETVIYSSIMTTTVAYVPVDVTVSLNAISKQKLHEFFFNLAPGLVQEVRVNPRKNIIAVDTTDEKTVQTLLGLSQLCGVSTRAYIPQGANVTAGVISDVDLELQDDVLKSLIVCTPPCKIISVLKKKAKEKASGEKARNRSTRPSAADAKTNIPARSNYITDSVRQKEGQKRNFLSATSWPALPSKTSEPVSEKIASHKVSEPASTKAPPTVENCANKTVSVEDDAKLINLLQMLINVVRSLIAGRQTPPALAAGQLLEALVPVLDGLR